MEAPIDDTFCSTCVTGEASCPICGLEGICEGTAIHFEVVTSETECEVNTVVDGYIERGNTYKMSAHFFYFWTPLPLVTVTLTQLFNVLVSLF